MKLTHLDYAVDGNVVYPLILIDQDLFDYFVQEDAAGRIEIKNIPRRRKKRGA
ncbi:hypothetical protein [Cohnella algarum]|uniref:hypothetical protein n=1 Tax=Cohnella algarum TaxID=2044859 RepID=UPI001967E634|nr:hypothetical protein [Cohnella algarum]MBN2980085.1 hypothetical protein [Cohnella algarum]